MRSSETKVSKSSLSHATSLPTKNQAQIQKSKNRRESVTRLNFLFLLKQKSMEKIQLNFLAICAEIVLFTTLKVA